jgi:hypothetical protein
VPIPSLVLAVQRGSIPGAPKGVGGSIEFMGGTQ